MSALTWDYETSEHVFRTHMQPLAEIKPAPVEWIWPRYLAAATVTTLSGEAGVGKTYLALAIAAALTNGKVPNDNRKRRPHDVLYFNATDSPGQILRPRFDSLGGDARRLHLLRYSVEPLGDEEGSEEHEEEDVKPAPPVLSQKERAAAKLAAERELQRLVELGHTDELTARQLRAIDPREHCGTADACPASCGKCKDFEDLLRPLGYFPRSELYEECQDEEENEAYEKERSEREKERERDGLSRTMETLAAALQETKARLLIVDTLDSLLEGVAKKGSAGRGSAEERADALRRLVEWLAWLAEERDCCVLLVRRVEPRRRGRRSRQEMLDMSEIAPIELLAGYSHDDPAQRALRLTRSRLGPIAPSLGYVINDDGSLCWTGAIDEPAPGATPLSIDQQHALGEAKEFLKTTLKQGQPAALEVLRQARQLGIAVRTLRRAKAALHVASEKRADGTWNWFMPT